MQRPKTHWIRYQLTNTLTKVNNAKQKYKNNHQALSTNTFVEEKMSYLVVPIYEIFNNKEVKNTKKYLHFQLLIEVNNITPFSGATNLFLADYQTAKTLSTKMYRIKKRFLYFQTSITDLLTRQVNNYNFAQCAAACKTGLTQVFSFHKSIIYTIVTQPLLNPLVTR